MKNRYNHLNLEEREKMAILLAEGRSLREIALMLGRHHSTLSRELERDGARKYTWFYIPYLADARAQRRREAKRPWRVLKNPQIKTYVEEKITLGWSPEQVSGRIKIDMPDQSISHEAIYKYIYYEADHLIKYLPLKRKSRYPKYRRRRAEQRRCNIPNRTPISERPRSAQTRRVFGHWECDAVVSRASKEALNVLVERKSRFTFITKLRQKTSSLTFKAIERRLSNLEQRTRRSITYDNGVENFQHEQVNEKLGTRSYFCNPYHSWEKGTVENTNGLIRRFIPKRTDIALVCDGELQKIEELLNNRPRKCLNYQTPKEVFESLNGALE